MAGKSPNQIYFDKLKENPLLFGFVYCTKHFRDKSAPFHHKIFNEMQRNRFLAVAAPRGSAKSTILAFLKPTHSVVFKLKRYICIIGASQEKANEKLGSIKKFFRDDSDFGIEMVKDTESEVQFRHPDKFETKISTFGREQVPKVRGAKFDAYRPDLIIIDDLEDDKQVENPELRREVREHFEDSILKSLDAQTGECIVIATVLNDDCLIARLVSKDHYVTWRKLRYKSLFKINGIYYSIWEGKKGWGVEELKADRLNNPRTFAKEKQNNPVSGAMARFKQEQFKRWDIRQGNAELYNQTNELVSKFALTDCKAAIACDLAWEMKRESDFSVIMPGFITPVSDILIEYYICKKGMRPHELQEILFSMVDRLENLTGSKVPVGFEKAQIEKVQKYLLKQAMRERNKFLITKELLWDADKTKRAEMRLEPRYAQGVIYHRANMKDLEYQLIRFPSGTHDDLVDAAQGLVQLLQYPKGMKKKKPIDEDPLFMQLRQFRINSKYRGLKPHKTLGRFQLGGQKKSRIPAEVCPI